MPREGRLQLRYAPLPDLLGAAAIVSLPVPATPETRGMIGARALAQMRPGAFLVNTARGELVDEAALRAAILIGHLAGAALDVVHREEDGGNPFADLPRVLVTPHIAGRSRAGAQRVLRRAIANVARMVNGAAPHDLVPPP